MEDQHHTVARLLDESPALVTSLAGLGVGGRPDAARDSPGELSSALCEHLETEETRVCP